MGAVLSVVIALVLIAGMFWGWFHGIKWLAEYWGDTSSAKLGAVVLGFVFFGLVACIGLIVGIKEVADKRRAKRAAEASLPELASGVR